MARIDDEDIFEPTMEMLRRENRPQAPEVTVEQPMFGGPMERMRSIQGDGNTKNVVDIVGSRGSDQVFRQLMSSPNFRAYIEVEDIPPATLAESKRVFDYLVKERSINDAVKYLFETFGQAPKSDLPIRESLGVSPIEQRITTYNESVMSSGDPMDRGINALR